MTSSYDIPREPTNTASVHDAHGDEWTRAPGRGGPDGGLYDPPVDLDLPPMTWAALIYERGPLVTRSAVTR